MEKDLDMKLYNEYLRGEKGAFELLYNKYKNKIQYFVFNIVKDYQKAEDITQEVFIYVLQNKIKEGYSFKYYIYLVAKSKALNYIHIANRRNDIIKQNLFSQDELIEKDVLEIITKEEMKKELIKSINLLEDKYKNAIYLVNIEGLTYKETAEILGTSLQNVKNLIHRGKKELRKILLKKGFENMNRVSKILIIIICTTALLSGIVYAVTTIYKNYNKNHNITFNPSYQSTLDENTINNLWIGTLDLAWKDLSQKAGRKIELEENIDIVNELNASNFSKEMLDPNDYKISVERTFTNGYKIDATLNKHLNFLEIFDNFSNDYNWTFGDNKEDYIKYFGINNASPESMNKNVEILFYNKIDSNNLNSNDFAVKLKTQEGDEIILYRTDDKKSFNEYYKDIQTKTSAYTGNREFAVDDELLIPYVRVNGMISYNELYGKEIKNSEGLYIYDVIQNVNFSLNEKGCNLSSQATMVTEYLSISEDTKYCYFKDTFVIFMKESNIENPYFALKVDNTDILERKEETDEPKILDHTMMADSDRYKVLDGEYLFYEDENYKYYYPNQKTKIVQVYFKNGDIMTAEEALKAGKITLELLNKYGVEYIKKEK